MSATAGANGHSAHHVAEFADILATSGARVPPYPAAG